jgi:hypothetical protein
MRKERYGFACGIFDGHTLTFATLVPAVVDALSAPLRGLPDEIYTACINGKAWNVYRWLSNQRFGFPTLELRTIISSVATAVLLGVLGVFLFSEFGLIDHIEKACAYVVRKTSSAHTWLVSQPVKVSDHELSPIIRCAAMVLQNLLGRVALAKNHARMWLFARRQWHNTLFVMAVLLGVLLPGLDPVGIMQKRYARFVRLKSTTQTWVSARRPALLSNAVQWRKQLKPLPPLRAPSTDDSYLMRLAPELRNQVYALASPNKRIMVWRNEAWSHASRVKPDNSMALTATSRRIKEETFLMFCAAFEVDLVFPSGFSGGPAGIKSALTGKNSCQDAFLRLVRRH